MTIENFLTTDDVANLAAAVESLSGSLLAGDLPNGTRRRILDNIDRLNDQIKQAASPPALAFAPDLFIQASIARMAALRSVPPLSQVIAHGYDPDTCLADACVTLRASARLYGEYGHKIGPVGLATQRRIEAQ